MRHQPDKAGSTPPRRWRLRYDKDDGHKPLRSRTAKRYRLRRKASRSTVALAPGGPEWGFLSQALSAA